MNLAEFKIEYLVVIVMALIILYLLYYVYAKDVEYSKNIRSIANVVEELNRELFYLKKSLTETQINMQKNTQRMSDDVIYEEIERSVYDMVQPINIGLQQLQENINAIDIEITKRIVELESGVKQINIPSSLYGNDDAKILSLFQEGVSVETISKELHLSQPEVEFVLKINKIK